MQAPIDKVTGESLVQYCLRRSAALDQNITSFMSHWSAISKVLQPRATRFNTTDVNTSSRRNTDIINNTGGYALNTLSSGLMSGVTSPSRPWFQLRTTDPVLNKRQAVKVWLDETRQVLNETFIKSNLYTTLPIVYNDLGGFGTSAFAVLEDDEDVIRCFHFPIGSYTLATGPRGNVTACFRNFMMTTSQLVKQFGLEQCSSTVQDNFKNKKFDSYQPVLHVVEENPDADASKLDSRYLPWRSVYLEKNNSEDKVLRLRGYHDFCVMAPRWSTTGEDVYGNSPGMEALGDILQLQKLEKRKLQLLDMLLDPPRNVPVSLRNEYIGTLSGERTFVPDHLANKVEPSYIPNPYLDHVSAEIREVENRIRRLLHESLFLMIADIERSGVTATEIQARLQEKMMVLGPVLERLNDDMLDPLVRRTLGILERAGKLPEPPPELQGQMVNVEYISTMAQAAKLQGVTGVERFVGFVGSLGAVRQDALDKISVDDAIDIFGDMVGVPPQLITDTAIANETRQQRAQLAETERSLAVAQQGAEAAKTLADTQVSTPSMLSAMSGAASQGAL